MSDARVYKGFTAEQLQAQYSARAAVPEHPLIFERWQARSAAFRAAAGGALDLSYGAGEREVLDLFVPGTANAPVLLFIHGGYWQAMDKGFFSFLAGELVRGGAAVAVMNYDLCPAVPLDRIVEQSRTALRWLWENAGRHGLDPARIHLCGHSAGGHLSAMLMATDWPAFAPGMPPGVIKSALAVSGLFDLEPLIHTAINDALGLDIAGARRNSPVLLEPQSGAPFVLAVGGEESREFHRQSREFREIWGAKGVPMTCLDVPGLNHFTMIEQLAVPGGLLLRHASRLMGLDRTLH